ncbi:excisionase [Pseudonocardiaceae bacterium YIM PH 21723]|nr:excisionase [Pseudonocardiaceae bacterium YIM PH 21723]
MATRRFITIAEICEELDIARSTFDTWQKKGVGPRCLQLPNRDIRIRVADYEQWLHGREVAA